MVPDPPGLLVLLASLAAVDEGAALLAGADQPLPTDRELRQDGLAFQLQGRVARRRDRVLGGGDDLADNIRDGVDLLRYGGKTGFGADSRDEGLDILN